MKYILHSKRRLALVAIDSAIFAACYYFAFVLRFDGWIFPGYGRIFWQTLPIAAATAFPGMYLAGAYRGIWRYASLNDLSSILKGIAFSTTFLIVGVVFLRGLSGYPRSVFLINAALSVLGMGMSRFAWRFYREIVQTSRENAGGKSVVIVGAGDAADDLIRELRQNPRIALRPVGIVDDKKEKMGLEIHGVKVIGAIEDLPRLVREKGAEEILIAIPSATGPQMRRIVEICRRTALPYLTVPGTGDIIGGRVKLGHLRHVKPEDLLRRPPARLDRGAIGGYVGGKKVLVTGAGGSIGSEICRQAAFFGPAEITFLDHSENGLYYLAEDFTRIFPGIPHRLTVADITDRNRMAEIFMSLKPDVVFHSAAHKHVHLMEGNIYEAFRNNVVGTRVAAEAAALCGTGKFVMISTDKAVNPASVMGLSKRMGEMVVQDLEGRDGHQTRFICVRFGNVMGSEGSVIPLFTRQIQAGGPVTVTHPEAVRYFMTIPEAAQLVLQAAAMGRGGEVFILDMGEPIRIADLAREMITLSGLEPGVDIEIRFVGMRPGEKLYEELVIRGEGIAPTDHEKIMVIHPDGGGGRDAGIMTRLDRLERLLGDGAGPAELLDLAREMVPEYGK